MSSTNGIGIYTEHARILCLGNELECPPEIVEAFVQPNTLSKARIKKVQSHHEDYPHPLRRQFSRCPN